MTKDSCLILKNGRERSVQKQHPWIFSGAVETIIGNPGEGETVRIFDSNNNFLAWAAYSPQSQISARIWTWDEGEVINPEFLHNRIYRAIALRQLFISEQITNSYRLLYSESDGIPGLIIDKYNDYLVLQFSSCGAEFWKESIINSSIELGDVKNCFERSDSEVRKLEGLPHIIGSLKGNCPPDQIEIHEWGIRYLVDIKTGQKTGFYLDQRTNRIRIREYAIDKRVLNCFSYTGGFTMNAILGKAAEVLSVDSSGKALNLAKLNIEINQFDDKLVQWIEGDVFTELRTFRDRGEKFDLIILDPPKFAPTVHSIEKANRAYKDINLLAFKLLNPGGILFTFSCSGGINAELFRKIIHGAAMDAGVNARILEQLHQDRDHPIPLSFPEAEYLKGLICQIN